MTQIDKHSPGAFCWIELGTSDQNAAKSFYGALFGWSVNDVPMGPSDFYTMFKLQGRDAGAAYTLRPDQREQGVPPHWMIYVAADSADEAANKASQLGATVLAGPFDVSDVGRMAVLRDPTGAVFSLWQPKRNSGIGIAGVDGALCWADLSTPDPARATEFYSGLFGWKIMAGEKDPSGYLHIVNGEAFIGGIPPAAHRDPNMPAHWLPYFTVSDCDASAAQATGLGARL
ncbi:MAG: VOC family protein, partial [Candidatus Solibacter usitatus]|nr:VOC family protein [Candidatus Solibacter usitatus]